MAGSILLVDRKEVQGFLRYLKIFFSFSTGTIFLLCTGCDSCRCCGSCCRVFTVAASGSQVELQKTKRKKGLEDNTIKLPRNTYKIEDTRRRAYVVVLFQCFRTANLISIAVIDVRVDHNRFGTSRKLIFANTSIFLICACCTLVSTGGSTDIDFRFC